MKHSPLLKATLLLLGVLLLSSCGTTNILTNRNDVDIYVNNDYKGRGSATIKRFGPPKKSEIEVRHHGREVGEMTIRRKFGWGACLVGYFTYGIGLVTFWEYPKLVTVPLAGLPGSDPSTENRDTISPWDLPPGSSGGGGW